MVVLLVELLFDMLNKRQEFVQSKIEYLNSISEFYNNAITDLKLHFRGNRLYLIFNSWEEIPSAMMMDFCNEFGYLAPTCIYNDAYGCIIRTYKFIKILN